MPISRAALKGIEDVRTRRAFELLYSELDRIESRFGKAISEEGVISGNLPGGVSVSGDIMLKGGFQAPVVTKTASSYTATRNDHVILCDCTSNAITVTLPALTGVGNLVLYIKKIDSTGNAVTVDGAGSDTIDGASSASLSSQYDVIAIITDGSAWYIL